MRILNHILNQTDPNLIYLEDDQWTLCYAGTSPAILIKVDDKKLVINLEQVRDMYSAVMVKEIKKNIRRNKCK